MQVQCGAVVCRDGLSASLSASLYASHSVPRIDAFKTVILLEEISVSQIIFLNKIIFDEQQMGGAVQGLQVLCSVFVYFCICICQDGLGGAPGEESSL